MAETASAVEVSSGSVSDGEGFPYKVWMVQKANCESSFSFCVCKLNPQSRFYCTSCFFITGGQKDCVHIDKVREQYALFINPPLIEDTAELLKTFQVLRYIDDKFQKPKDEFQMDMLETILFGSVDALQKIRVRSEATYLSYMQMSPEDREITFQHLISRKVFRDTITTYFRDRKRTLLMIEDTAKFMVQENQAQKDLIELQKQEEEKVTAERQKEMDKADAEESIAEMRNIALASLEDMSIEFEQEETAKRKAKRDEDFDSEEIHYADGCISIV